MSSRIFIKKIEMGVSIIIPTYNERENIIELIQAINRVLPKKWSYEVIIVDDNSPDGTAQAVIRASRGQENVRVLVRKKSDGLAGAILYGIRQSRGEVIVGMDADFNHPPELLPRLVRETKKADLVIASRFIKDGGMEDKGRYLATYWFNLLLKHVLGFPTMDNMSGYYVIKREKLNQLPFSKIYQGYGEYHLRLVWLAQKRGFKITEIPVYYLKRKHGRSKSHLWQMFWHYLLTALQLRYN